MKRLEPEEKEAIQRMLNVAANSAVGKINFLLRIAFFIGLLVGLLICTLLVLPK